MNTLRTILLLFTIFIASRVVYLYTFDLQFDAGFFDLAWQALDKEWLLQGLGDSLIYLHTQPPVYNLVVGTFLHVFGEGYASAFWILNMAGSFSIGLCLFYFFNQCMRFHPIWGWSFFLFWVWFPTSILYELVLTYETISLAIGSLSIPALWLAISRKKTKWWLIFFILVSLLVLTRTMFHWAVYLGSVIGLMYFLIKDRRILIAGFISLLFPLTWLLKNWVVFGVFSTTSWFGLNFANTTVNMLPEEDRLQLVEAGKISAIAREWQFDEIIFFEDWYTRDETFEAHPVTGSKMKPNGFINLHHYGYIETAREYLKASFQVLVLRPDMYVFSLFKSLVKFNCPTTEYFMFEENIKRMGRMYYDVMLMVSGQFKYFLPEKPGKVSSVHALLMIFIPFFLLWNRSQVAGELKTSFTRNQLIVIGFIVFRYVYVFAVTSIFEQGENMRFRFMVLSDEYILLGLFVFLFFRLKKGWLLPRP